MTPRKPQPGASANAKRASAAQGRRGASSSRSRTSAAKPASRAKTATRGLAGRAKAANTPKRSNARTSANPVATLIGSWFGPNAHARWYLLPLIVVAALVIVTWTYYPVARVQYRETRQKQLLQTELASLKARNARLHDSVERLKTPEGVEDYARSQLGMAKKGEHVLVVVDGTKREATSTPLSRPDIDSDETSAPAPGPWTAFLDAVFRVE